jgi:hypothetical protein
MCAPDGGCFQEAPICPAIDSFLYGHQLTPVPCKNTTSRTKLTPIGSFKIMKENFVETLTVKENYRLRVIVPLFYVPV